MTEFNRIPLDLRTQTRWVNAKPEDRDGRTTKVPYCAHNPTQRASSTDKTTWSDFETAEQNVQRGDLPWLGFVLGDRYVGVDLDKCRDAETGVIEPWAEAIVKSLNSYTEVSVSGAGIHIICRGSLPGERRRIGRIEMYDSDRYFVMTGNVLKDAPVEERTDALAELYRQTFSPVSEPAATTSPSSTDRHSGTTAALSDAELVTRIASSAQGATFTRLWSGDITGYPSHSEADQALCGILAFWTNGDANRVDALFRKSGLMRDKWNREDYRSRTISTALKGMTGNAGHCGTDTTVDDDGETTSGPSKSAASKLVALVRSRNDADLFHTPSGDVYITVSGRTMRLDQGEFRDWLAHEYYRTSGKTPGANALKDASSTLAGHARFEGPERPVFMRVAAIGSRVYLDLGSGVIEVSDSGWRLTESADVRFIRPNGFLPLPTPVRSTMPLATLLTSFLNISDSRDLMLVTGWLVGALRGRKPFPILNVTGEQGSAKSSACRFLRRIVDPNLADTRLPAKDVRDLMIAAHNGYVIAYENLTRIEDWLANGLCCLATGASISTRALYSNTDEVIINASRPILLNGINDVMNRGDLQDRAIQVTLDAIPDSARKTETEVNAVFEHALPGILAALLDAVACALKNEPTTVLKRRPRMADFAETVTAAELALGWEPGAFLAAYDQTRQESIERMLDDDPVVKRIRLLELPWSGTPDQLRMELSVLVNSNSDDFPKTARAMGMSMRTLAPLLPQVGIGVVTERKRTRLIHLRRIPTANTVVDIHVTSAGRSLPVGDAGEPEPVEQTQVGCVGASSASALPLLNAELVKGIH